MRGEHLTNIGQANVRGERHSPRNIFRTVCSFSHSRDEKEGATPQRGARGRRQSVLGHRPVSRPRGRRAQEAVLQPLRCKFGSPASPPDLSTARSAHACRQPDRWNTVAGHTSVIVPPDGGKVASFPSRLLALLFCVSCSDTCFLDLRRRGVSPVFPSLVFLHNKRPKNTQ